MALLVRSQRKNTGSDEDHSSTRSQDQDAQDDDDDVQWQTDTSLEAAKKRIQEQQLSAVTVECCYLFEQ